MNGRIMEAKGSALSQLSELSAYTNTVSQIERVPGGKVQIYGASKLGWFVAKGAMVLGLEVERFIDNRLGADTYLDIPVCRSELVPQSSKDSLTIVAIFRGQSRDRLEDDLRQSGFNSPGIDPFVFLYAYFKYVANRDCHDTKFADSINNLRRFYYLEGHPHGQVYDDLFVSPLVVGNITQKCNLKCMDCAQLIPYYENPISFSSERIIEEVRAFCDSVDLVPEISLHGGEPFLHSDLGEICLELAKIPNLIFINLITNGTVLPKPDVWAKLGMAGVDIHQSDYRTISKRQAAVFSLCDQNNIYCDIDYTHTSEMWHRSKPFQDYKRSKQVNDALYRQCVDTKICAQILDGSLYRCPVSAHAGRQGYFENSLDEDFVKLTAEQDRGERRKKVRGFLARKECLTACRYCDPFNPIEVIPALQLTPQNRAKLARGEEVM